MKYRVQVKYGNEKNRWSGIHVTVDATSSYEAAKIRYNQISSRTQSSVVEILVTPSGQTVYKVERSIEFVVKESE